MSDSDFELASGLFERFLAAAERDPDDPAIQSRLTSLRIANAAIAKARLNETRPDHARQITVVGPTQSGKSSIVNLLLGADAAGVSALAGYTRHAHGFYVGDAMPADRLDEIAALLVPLRRASTSELEADAYDRFAIDNVATPDARIGRHALVWDTPDFDSISSGRYREGLLATVAIADLLVLVTSRDKYADRSVRDFLQLVAPLGRPLLAVLNKLDDDEARLVVDGFRRHHAEALGSIPHELAVLPNLGRGQSPRRDLPPDRHAAVLTPLTTLRERHDRSTHGDGAQRFIAAYRDDWLAPVRAELGLRDWWRARIRDAIDQAEHDYANRYLENPAHYDTFDRALAALLHLLELPGLAEPLQKARTIVTWPVRQLLGFGRRQWAARQGAPDTTAEADAPPVDHERDTLEQLARETLNRLQAALRKTPGHTATQAAPRPINTTGVPDAEHEPAGDATRVALTRALATELDRRRESIRQDVIAATVDYQRAFEPEIEATAHRLYAALQRQPVVLNSLRAARFGTDAAGVAFAVKSGGLAPTDLIVAPAMLSVTTLLTESVLGRYLDTMRRDLKDRQRREVRRRVLDAALATPLLDLAERATASSGAGLVNPELESLLDRRR